MKLLQYIRGYVQRPLVRPWALAGPVLVLMLCLPMLRPLRQPDPTQWSDEEQMVASTVQAIVEHRTLAIDDSVFSGNPAAIEHEGRRYSPYPPMLAVLLSPVYWLLLRQGLDYGDSVIFVHYLLTLIGVTLPVAMCAGMMYRLGRMFVLHRALRVGLGLASVCAGGLLTYGVVMNRHAPAAALLLAAIFCISRLIVTEHPHRDLVVAAVGGLFAALAATVDPPAIVLGTLLCLVLLAMRWNARHAHRCGRALPGRGGSCDLRQHRSAAFGRHSHDCAFAAPQARSLPLIMVPTVTVPNMDTNELPLAPDEDVDFEPSAVQLFWGRMADWIGRILESLVGEHGLLSHFPILVVGMLGAIWVLHRNWTTATKAMAATTLVSCVLLILAHSFQPPAAPMSYAAPWFIATSPALLLWGGAWLKRGHRVQSWIVVGCLLAFSVVVTIVGMTNPAPRGGYRGYSFAEASINLLSSPAEPSTTQPTKP